MSSIPPEGKPFRTLRGFIARQEPDEEEYFAYSASLRIFGEHLDFEDINAHLDLLPTQVHHKGDPISSTRPHTYTHDLWLYSPPVEESRALTEHIDALWASIKHARTYLLDLKKVAAVDVFLGYRSNVDMAGVQVPHTCLEMFVELEIPFGLSIIIT